MKKIFYLLLILLIACNPKTVNEETKDNTIAGNWAFLDARGNYCEAFFGDSTFITFNMAYGPTPYFYYTVKNDSLYSTVDKRKSSKAKIATLSWFNPDKVIIITELSRDTLDRIKDPKNTLQYIDLTKDSLEFFHAVKTRYEDFLVAKGILTRKEIEQFKKDRIVPEDVKKSVQP